MQRTASAVLYPLFPISWIFVEKNCLKACFFAEKK